MVIGFKQIVVVAWLAATLSLAGCDRGGGRAAPAVDDSSGAVTTPTSEDPGSSAKDGDPGSEIDPDGDTTDTDGSGGGGGGATGGDAGSNEEDGDGASDGDADAGTGGGDGSSDDGSGVGSSDGDGDTGTDGGSDSSGDGDSGDDSGTDGDAGTGGDDVAGDPDSDGNGDGDGSDDTGSNDDDGTGFERIELTYAGAVLPAGLQQQYRAYGIPADGSTPVDVTPQASWAVSSTELATIGNSAGSHGVLSALAVGSVLVTVTFETLSAEADLQITDAVLESLTVTPDGETLYAGQTYRYAAIGAYSDNSEQDVSARVSWSVEADPSLSGGAPAAEVAAISNAGGEQGLLSALGAGDALVVATLGAVRGEAAVEVIANSLEAITLAPDAGTLPAGLSLAFEATGTFADGTQIDVSDEVLWQSSDEAIASLDTAGLASGHASGTVTVSATLGSVTAAATLEVTDAALSSIAITPANMTLPLAFEQPYTAIATFSDGSTLDVSSRVSWSSSNPEVATIDNGDAAGRVRTLSAGSTQISAVLGAYSTAVYSTTLIVDDSLVLSSVEVDPSALSCGYGQRYAFRAVGVYESGARIDLTRQVRWTSSKPKLVSIGLGTGQAKVTRNPNRTGIAQITATLAGLTGTADVTKLKSTQACEAGSDSSPVESPSAPGNSGNAGPHRGRR